MPKYVYIGDPKGKPHASGECVLVEGTSKERFTFKVGEPREVPAWVLKCVKANSHFRLVEEAQGQPLSLKDAKPK